MVDWILIILVGALAATIYFYFHFSSREVRISEGFIAQFDGITAQKEPAVFTPIGNYDPDLTPPESSSLAYFKEDVTVPDINTALSLSITATVRETWGDMFQVNTKQALNDKKAIISILEEALNSALKKDDVPFKVKGAIPLQAVSPNGSAAPFFYCKWDILAHRGNKLYGFSFEAVFLHMDDIIQLCSFSKVTQVNEDKIETITVLPKQLDMKQD